MSHNIEQYGDQASFVEVANAKEGSAWHRLGTVVPHSVTALEGMKIAHLTGWDVRKVGLTAQGLAVPGAFATVRNNPYVDGQVDVLGVVGSVYQPYQNEVYADVIDLFTHEVDAHIETTGSLDEGRKTFVTIKLPQTLTVGGEDDVDVYVTFTNSHDGSSKFEAFTGLVRVVCENTLTLGRKNAKARFGIRHTTHGEKRFKEVREALNATFTYVAEFEEEAERLIQTSLTDSKFEEIVKGLYPEPEDEGRGKTLWTEKFDSIWDTYQNDATQTNVHGTAWGGYQAITRYYDHVAPVSGEKDKDRPDDGWVAKARAERTATDRRFEGFKIVAYDAFAAV